MFAPGTQDQSPAIEPATGETRDEVDNVWTSQISDAIRGRMSYPEIQKYWPTDLTQEQYDNAVKNRDENPGFNGDFFQVIRTVPNGRWNRIVNGPVGAFSLSEIKSLIPLRPFLSKQQQTELDMVLEANPGWAAAGGLTGELVNSYTLGPLYESGLGLVAPKLGEKAISLTAETSMGALKGALDAKDGEGGWGALTGGFGGLVKGWSTYKAKRYLDELALERLENLPRLNNFLTDHLVPTMVSGLYDAGAEQLKTPSAPPTLEDVTDDRSGKMEGGTPATVLQSTPGSSSPANLYAQSMSSRFRSNVQPAPRQSYQPTPFAVPTADQGTADFYAQLGDLRRNADAVAVGPYPNPGDAARAAQLADPRPVYPTDHPYGFGAGFEPDQVASGRPYAVAPHAAAVPADDQGTIVYRPQPPTFHGYGAQPGVGLYGDAGGDPHYGLSYDDGAGGYAQDGLDGFDFLSPASVHAGGWQHPPDAFGQGSGMEAGLLVAAPGARFGYGGAARSPVIGGIIPLGLGAAARSDGSGGGSGSVPLYSSYTGYGGGDWGAQPDVSIVPDPSGWSPHSAVRNILAIAPDDGQGPPNWLDPNTPPQIMLNVPDLSRLIR